MPLRKTEMSSLEVRDMVVIERSDDYIVEAMEYGGVLSTVTSIRRDSSGLPNDIRIDADELGTAYRRGNQI